MKSKIFLFILGIVLSLGLKSQNLVVNPSFEEFEKCPEGYTDFTPEREFLIGWSYPSKGTPDFFHTCSQNKNVSVPKNFMGSSQPRTGKGYAGVFIMGQGAYSEYLQSHLMEPLEAGTKYCITYWYRLAQNGKFAADRIDLFFSKTQVFINKEDFLKLRPQAENPSGKMMRNKDSWALYSGVYEAKGGEQFMIIGNFVGYQRTQRLVVADKTGFVGKGGFSYYYIDDVSVKEIKECKDCEGIPQDLKVDVATNYSNPTGYSANDGAIELSVSGGQPPYTVEWEGDYEGFKLANLAFGNYKYKVRDHYNCDVSETVTFFTAVADTSYSGGNTGHIELKIAGGVGPYKVEWSNGARENILNNLGEGEYTYVVTDSKGLKIEGAVTFSEFSNKLNNINEGDAIVLDNIFFETASIELLPQSYVALDKIVDFFNDSGVKLVEVSGHTDNTGSLAINQKISEGRAKSVVDYLVQMGVAKDRISYIGSGPDSPVAKNNSEEGRQKNRRVEFKIVKK